MEKNRITICIAAFNRPESLKRLLNCLKRCNYNNDIVNLYISIDRSKIEDQKNTDCFLIAKDFEWKYGEKIVDYKNKNLGLKSHILQCGNLTNKYDNIIMLEDDIYVSPNFYLYAKKVLDFYKDNEKIAGFGLYSFQINPGNRLPFYPMTSEHDVFFMQYACSWGQMWTKRQWNDFYEWFKKHDLEDLKSENFPDYISNWSEKSWLKYYMKYVVESDKYFVYPYKPYTTNFSEVGTHNVFNDIGYQTLLSNTDPTNFSLCDVNETDAVYDIFFENKKIDKYIGLSDDCDINFYGLKTVLKKKYLLSPKKLNYKIVNSYDLSLYSYELNIKNNISGNGIYIYDTSVVEKNKLKQKIDFYSYIYRIPSLTKKEYLKLSILFIKRMLNKLFK